MFILKVDSCGAADLTSARRLQVNIDGRIVALSVIFNVFLF